MLLGILLCVTVKFPYTIFCPWRRNITQRDITIYRHTVFGRETIIEFRIIPAIRNKFLAKRLHSPALA
jgi:hypothetical protein